MSCNVGHAFLGPVVSNFIRIGFVLSARVTECQKLKV